MDGMGRLLVHIMLWCKNLVIVKVNILVQLKPYTRNDQHSGLVMSGWLDSSSQCGGITTH